MNEDIKWIDSDESADGYEHIAEYTIINEIGRGSFGSVKSALYGGDKVALKILSKRQLKHFRVFKPSESHQEQYEKVQEDDTNSEVEVFENGIDKAKREISILTSLEHPHIIKLLRIFEDDWFIVQVLPLMKASCMQFNSTSRKYFQLNKQTGGVASPTALKYAKALTEGIIFLHERGIVHRDIKPENLLISYVDNLVIADFGCAIQFNPLHSMGNRLGLVKDSAGTPSFWPPESLSPIIKTTSSPSSSSSSSTTCEAKLYYSAFSADTWAVGVTLYTMLCEGRLPFDPIAIKISMQEINVHGAQSHLTMAPVGLILDEDDSNGDDGYDYDDCDDDDDFGEKGRECDFFGSLVECIITHDPFSFPELMLPMDTDGYTCKDGDNGKENSDGKDEIKHYAHSDSVHVHWHLHLMKCVRGLLNKDPELRWDLKMVQQHLLNL